MAKKESLTCSSCYRPIKGEHFTVPTGSRMMAFHKNAHECAAASPHKTGSIDAQRITRGGGAAEHSEYKYQGTN